MRKQKAKRMTAIILTLMMFLSLSVPVIAESTDVFYYGQITDKWIDDILGCLCVDIVDTNGAESSYKCVRTRVNGVRYSEIDALNESIPLNAYVKFTATDGERIDVLKIAKEDSATTITGISCVDMSDNNCRYTVKIESEGAPNGEFIVAVYDIDGRFIGIKNERKTIIFEETITDTVAVNGIPHTYKAFFWDSLDNLVPICDNAEGSVSK